MKTFDVVMGNPPYNSASRVHLKIVGKLKDLMKKDGLSCLVMPKQILARGISVIKKHTSWIDTCSSIEHHDIDMKKLFPNVGDKLIWFSFKNDDKHHLTDLTPYPLKRWKGRRVKTVMHQASCSKKKSETNPVPAFTCVKKDGLPQIEKRFATAEVETAWKKSNLYGVPKLLVNMIFSLALRGNPAFLDEDGTLICLHGFAIPYIFDDMEQATECRDFLNSKEGQSYIEKWCDILWCLGPAMELLLA